MLRVNSRETTFEHQRVPATRFNNIFPKLFDRHATFAPINVKPEVGGTPGICGAFDLFCLPHPREFDLESGPQGGDVCFFFARRTGS